MERIETTTDRDGNTVHRIPSWYEEEKERERRLARALEGDAAADEAAAAFSSAVMDGQEIESAHDERIERLYRGLCAVASIFDDSEVYERVQQQILRDFAYSAWRNLQWLDGRMDKHRAELQEKIAQNDGSEVADTDLIRSIEFGQRLVAQSEAWADYFAAAKKALVQLTGEEFKEPVGRDQRERSKTLATAQAKALLEALARKR